MNPEGLLLELLCLAEEVLEKGPADGRAYRMAGLVLRLNEFMHKGELPLSWRPTAPRGPLFASPSIHVPPLDRLPKIDEPGFDSMIAALDDGWDDGVVYLDANEVELIAEGPVTSLRPSSLCPTDPSSDPAGQANLPTLPPDG